MIAFDDILSGLNLPKNIQWHGQEWPAWRDDMPVGPLPFLASAFVREGCEYLGISQQVTQAVLAASPRLDAHPLARALLWHGHCLAFHRRTGFSSWPALHESLGTDGDLFYLLLLISGYRWVQAYHHHHHRHLPTDIARDTVQDVQRFIDRFERHNGRIGLAPLYAGGWLLSHLHGRLYRLGRLQYIHTRFPTGYRVYQHRKNHQQIVLAEDGRRFRTDGLVDGAGGVSDPKAWTSRLYQTASQITGHPVDTQRAVVQQQPKRLNTNHWELILGPGDGILDMHIPDGPPLTLDAVRHSLQQAGQFFDQYFPEQPFKAFYCDSWLLDPQLGEYLAADSNIMRFQRLYHLLPSACDGYAAARFVFELEIPYGSTTPLNLTGLPCKTTLQKAILQHLQAGRPWHKAGGYILRQEVSA